MVCLVEVMATFLSAATPLRGFVLVVSVLISLSLTVPISAQ
jgi:hypothetical protein